MGIVPSIIRRRAVAIIDGATIGLWAAATAARRVFAGPTPRPLFGSLEALGLGLLGLMLQLGLGVGGDSLLAGDPDHVV